MSDIKVIVIVPAYNEEEAISSTLTHLTQTSYDICVINDGSKDRTSEIAKTFTKVHVIDMPFNVGIGSAMQTGYKFAHKNGYDIALQFDADGQHSVEDLEKLIEPIANGEADMVVGSRFLEKTDYKGTITRRIGILYFYQLLKIITGEKFTDPTSGYRAKNKKVIAQFSEKYPKDYPEPEVLVQLKKRKMIIKDISVHMKDRQGGKSSITPFKSIYYMIKVSLSIFMQKIKKG